MPEINPLSNEQIFLKKIAENTGSNYNTGDVSEINPLTIDQILLKEIAANTADLSGDITELEGKVADNTSAIEATQDMISDAYDPTAPYAVGDYCIYNNVLYKCNTAIATGEAFTPAKWDATTVADEIKANSDMLTPLPSVQLTMNTNVVSSGAGKYTKIGRLVFVNAEFTPSSVANEGVIATGLPKVLNGNCSVWDGFAQTLVRNTQNDDAQWCFWFPTHTDLDRRQLSFMYISQN